MPGFFAPEQPLEGQPPEPAYSYDPDFFHDAY
jgi:hypothetical protein